MSILAELQKKYGFKGAKFEPKPSCKFCSGTGERKLKHRNGMTFCICLFVDHSLSDFAGDSLRETAQKLQHELKESNS